MSKIFNLPFDEDAIDDELDDDELDDDELDDDEPFDDSSMNDWSEDIFREFCGKMLKYIATELDETNNDVYELKRKVNYIHPDMEDVTERLEMVEGRNRRLSMDVDRLQRRLIPAAIGSAALLGASIITGAVLRKRR